jgi:hypothetical protein
VTMRMPTLLPFGEGCMSGVAIDTRRTARLAGVPSISFMTTIRHQTRRRAVFPAITGFSVAALARGESYRR